MYLRCCPGALNLTNPSGNEQTRTIDKFIPHENYDQNTADYDIALLKFNAKVEITDYVKPVCLPENEFPVGYECYVSGWGYLEEGGKGSDIVHFVKVGNKNDENESIG